MRSRTDRQYDSLRYNDVPYQEARERLAKSSVSTMAMRILGEPVRFRGYRGSSRDGEAPTRQEFRLGEKTFLYAKGEGWTDIQGEKIDSPSDRDRWENRWRVEKKVDTLLKERFPSTYDLLDTVRHDRSNSSAPHLTQVQTRLLARLHTLPSRQLKVLIPSWEGRGEDVSHATLLSRVEKTLLEDVMTKVSAGRKTRSASELYVIGSFLKGEPLEESDAARLEKLMK